MADLKDRKVFKVFNQDFIVDDRYTVTKELGQGAYGIVWYILSASNLLHSPTETRLVRSDASWHSALPRMEWEQWLIRPNAVQLQTIRLAKE